MKGTVNSKKQSVFHEKVFEIRDRLCRVSTHLSHVTHTQHTVTHTHTHTVLFNHIVSFFQDYLSNLRSREEAAKERGSVAKGEEESKLKKWQSSLDNVKKLYVV